jgi:hypothetical protein
MQIPLNGAMAFSIMTFGRMTLSLMTPLGIIIQNKMTPQQNDTYYKNDQQYNTQSNDSFKNTTQ